jgi:hypothetical protein
VGVPPSGNGPAFADEPGLGTRVQHRRSDIVTAPTSGVPRTVDTDPARKGSSQTFVARRSPRVAIDMPVEVVGQRVNGKVFRQETRATAVNAHGAQLILGMAIEIQPSIHLRNKKVVYQKRIETEKAELGIEFVDPRPTFWGITFPPGDWSAAQRKMPVLPSK